MRAVFTRTLADPDGGLKLTGKVGGSTNNVIGLFTAQDRITNLLFPSNQTTSGTSLDQRAWTTVGRFRRDLGRSSHAGLLYTGRFGAGYFNQVAGPDVFYQLGVSLRFNGQYLASITEYPDSVAAGFHQPNGSFAGGALSLALNYGTNHWDAGISYIDLSPRFRADVGFVPRVDTRTLGARLGPLFYRGRGWFNVIGFGPFISQTRNHTGTLTDQDLGISASYQGPFQTQLYLQFFNHRERYLDRLYNLSRTTGYLDLKPIAGVGFNAQWQIGDGIDYTNAREAKEVTVLSAAEVSLGRGLTLDLSDTYQRLTDRGTGIFTANIVQSKVAYNFSVRTQLRAILQYRDVQRNITKYTLPADPNEKGLLGQFLFSYRVNPRQGRLRLAALISCRRRTSRAAAGGRRLWGRSPLARDLR